MKGLLLLSLILFVSSCNTDKKEKQVNDDTVVGEIKTIDSIPVLSIKQVDSFNQHRKDFFSVYELSKNTIALVANMSDRKEENTIFDTIFKNLSKTDSLIYSTVGHLYNCSYFDTVGEYPLLKSIKLDKEMRKRIDSEYYVYGTKGYVKAKVKDIVFGFHECGTGVFAFCLDKIDTSKIGHPIIASHQLYNLNYGGNYSKIFTYTKENKKKAIKEGDFTDKIETKVFANAGNLYFTFHDDFQWGYNPQLGECLYPDRSVYKLNNDGSYSLYWSEDLDLFGIECL